MGTDKKSFVLYHDIRTPLELLSDGERGKLFMAILDYSEYGTQPDFDGALQMAFAFIQTAIDRDSEAWEIKREKRREAGSKGGKQRVANQANATFAKQKQANQAVPVPAPVSVLVPVIENKAGKPPRTRFVPPTLEEVSIYCQQRGNTVDPQRFIDYYEANGWVQGKGKPIRDWQAAVRTWENGSMQKRQPTQEQPDLSWRDSRSVTLDDLVEYPANSGQYRPRSEVPHD